MAFFEIGAELPRETKRNVAIVGTVITIALWQMSIDFFHVKPSVMCSPAAIIIAFPRVVSQYHLLYNTFYSGLLNVLGYLEAIVISFVFGFIIGLSPRLRAVAGPYLAAMRYVPIVVLTETVIALFGIALNMKVQFLALGITVYLLPMVVERVVNVTAGFVEIAKTIGATKWQQIKTVIIPDVVSRVSMDTLLLVAISWTYISFVEMVNANDGGLGALLFRANKASDWASFWLIIFEIAVLGLGQDKLIKYIDKKAFPFK